MASSLRLSKSTFRWYETPFGKFALSGRLLAEKIPQNALYRAESLRWLVGERIEGHVPSVSSSGISCLSSRKTPLWPTRNVGV